MSNTDLNSGMGGEKLLGYFWGYDEAFRFGRGKGVMGGDCYVAEKVGMIDKEGAVRVDGMHSVAVGGSLDDAVDREKARVKLSAADLTPREYLLLGIPVHARNQWRRA
jgi:hypothetical protein